MCSGSSEPALNNFKNLPLPLASTSIIERPKNERTNNNTTSQVLELDIELQMTSFNEKNSENKTGICE